MAEGLDNELKQDFLVEAGELVERLSEQLVDLERTPEDAELLNAVFRAFHTVKGGAGFLQLEPLVQLCHHAEDLLNLARNGKVTIDADHMDALLETTDLVTGMMGEVANDEPLTPAPETLLKALLPRGSAPAPAAAPAPAPASAPGTINDDEFEALLDKMYGTNAPGAVAPAPIAPPGTGDAIGEDEFEALLDQLHGKGGSPGHDQPDAVPAAAAPAPVAAAAPATQPAAKTPVHHAAAAETTVRVDTARLDVLVNHAGELVLARNRLLSLAARTRDDALAAAATELDRITDELQTSVMGMRMQPVGRLFQRFPRIVRDLSRQLGKEVELVLEGEDTDLDRSLVEALADPMVHLIRNALDHGIGLPDERERAGKPRQGKVTLSASQRGERIIIMVTDDGRGMDPEILRRKAVEKGIIDAAQAARLTEAECYELIFRPGFSTAAKVSDISGRGVGMDVVKTRITELGGTLGVRSRLGSGSELELAVPLTLAVLRVLMVRVGDRLLALPLGNVEEVFELEAGQATLLDGRLVARHRDRALPLVDLVDWCGVAAETARHVAVLHIGHQRLGCQVHEVLGREDVIVKPLGHLFHGVPGVAGATITGDGRLALVMDLASVADNPVFLAPPLAKVG